MISELSLRDLVDIQVEMSSVKLDMQIWSSEDKSRLEYKFVSYQQKEKIFKASKAG